MPCQPIAFQQVLQKPAFHSFIKGAQTFYSCIDGLRLYVKGRVHELHKKLKEDVTRELGSIQSCRGCPAKKEPAEHRCKICWTWRNKILEHHANGDNITWSNVDPKKFLGDPWEVAKAFMNKGKKAGELINQETLDVSSILNLMIDCKIFRITSSAKSELHVS